MSARRTPAGWRAAWPLENDDFRRGLTLRGFIAPFVLDGPINRVAFETYVEKVLAPELREGDTVIMDNLPGHKGPRVRQPIEAAAPISSTSRPTVPTSIPSRTIRHAQGAPA